VFQFGTWVGSPSYNSGNGWHALPLPAGVNDGEWEELTVDLQEILDNLSSGTLTDIDKIEWRGDAAFDTVRVGAARTTKIYTLAPSALGGIISIRELERDTYYDTDNVDTWYHCDRLGSVALTSDSAGASNGLRWQDAYGNQLASVSNGGWASAAASEGYGLTTKEFDGDVELYYFWQRWLDPTLGIFVSSAPLSAHLEHPFGYAESNPVLRIDPDGNVSRPVAEQCLKEAKDQPNPSYGACGTAAAVDCHQARQCLRRYGIDPNNEVPCRFEICGFPSAGRVCVHAWCCVKCD
jgi:RHS repeat-associated protein